MFEQPGQIGVLDSTRYWICNDSDELMWKGPLLAQCLELSCFLLYPMKDLDTSELVGCCPVKWPYWWQISSLHHYSNFVGWTQSAEQEVARCWWERGTAAVPPLLISVVLEFFLRRWLYPLASRADIKEPYDGRTHSSWMAQYPVGGACLEPWLLWVSV